MDEPRTTPSLSLSAINDALELWRASASQQALERASSEGALEFLCAMLPLLRKMDAARPCLFGVISRRSFDDSNELIEEHPASHFCALWGEATMDAQGSEAFERWQEQWWDDPGTRSHFSLQSFQGIAEFFEYLRAHDLRAELDHELCAALGASLGARLREAMEPASGATV